MVDSERQTRAAARAAAWHEAFSGILRVEDRYYILATSSLSDDRPRVMKQGETFALFDHYGDIKPVGLEEEGVYHEGTRFLSSMLLRLGNERPMFLSSTVRQDGALLTVDLTNPDLQADGHLTVPRGMLHIQRSKLLWQGVSYERLQVRNYGLVPVSVPLALHFAADFADIFEVRGVRRIRRGRYLDPAVHGDEVVLAYEGLDGVTRRSRLQFTPVPDAIHDDQASYDVTLAPGARHVIDVTMSCQIARSLSRPMAWEAAAGASREYFRAQTARGPAIDTSNEQFGQWLGRSRADLGLMTTETPQGIYPYAGIPWFSTTFGRDGIITALECLWTDPEMARGVLRFLAANQATEHAPERDAEPGKILHETRKGEMAALREIPFGRYYGSVDSTPLFVMLAGAFYRRTGDHDEIERLWPHIEAALEWIERSGDVDGDGFVEYQRRSPDGLANQGWKDSYDSIFHADGSLAMGPIALCEVQGYVFAARLAAADLASVLGHHDRAIELERQAQTLRRRFEAAFWCEDIDTYAIALDGEKRPCRVRTTNAGHCLYTGIASAERAARLATTLLDAATFSGWGLRTLAASEPRYNPMSYHNGSIWPHDNAMVAHGLARYGFKEEALRVFTGLYDARASVDLFRLPELFCGFDRSPGSSPTQYPVACSPQAWASGAVFLLLEACLGLEVDAASRRVRFRRPVLPPFLDEIEISNFAVGEASLDFVLRRHGDDVSLDLRRRQGKIEVLIVK
jgi:glycogen debranching enzyme